ncbi:GNAT family N-acetyltransferase [Desulfopila aestuarii]|nr:GNAT family N-acetyltransferase [Desulfopila aestuarii]
MKLVRTDSNNPAFRDLTRKLDAELHARYGRQQAQYDRHNVVDLVKTVIGYIDEMPIACGCLKLIASQTVELKRMYVDQKHRKKGYAVSLLQALEAWCIELGINTMILETGKGQPEAIGLYQKCGFAITENFGPYIGNTNSVCMQKQLTSSTTTEIEK